MSSDIVYRIEAIRFTKEEVGDYDDKFLVVQEAGSSNCWEAGNRRRSRNWQAFYFGQHYQVIAQVCDSAGQCEGGMLRLTGNSHTSPESYIKAHRRALANAAVGIAGAAQRGLKIEGRIRCAVKADDTCELNRLAELSKVKTLERDNGYSVFRFDLTKPNDLKLWAKHVPLPAWRACEVYGPGE